MLVVDPFHQEYLPGGDIIAPGFGRGLQPPALLAEQRWDDIRSAARQPN